MIISTNGKANQHVRSAWLGGRPVWSIWLGGQRLYPDAQNNATMLAFEPPAMTDDLWNYWQHTVYAKKEDSTPSSRPTHYINYLQAIINGKTYTDKSNGCQIDLESGLIVLGDYSFIMANEVYNGGQFDIKIKASVTARVEPKLNGNTILLGGSGSASVEIDMPLLPDMTFETWRNKGQKKHVASVNFDVSGVTSGQKFVWGFGNLAGHWRGTQYNTFDSKNGGIIGNQSGQRLSVNNVWVKGDYGWKLAVEMWESGENFKCKATYPAFTKTFNVKYIRRS